MDCIALREKKESSFTEVKGDYGTLLAWKGGKG